MNHNFRNFQPGMITREGAQQLNLLARYVERIMRLGGAYPVKVSRGQNPVVSFDHLLGDIVRVSSTTTTGGRYPGYLLTHDVDNDTYTDADEIWVVDINGGALMEENYLAHESYFTAGRKVYIVGKVAGPPFWTFTYPTQLTTSVNDYDPGAGDIYYIDQDGPYEITGIDTTSTNDLIVLYNASSFVLKLTHEDASSTAEYRIKTPTQTDIGIPPLRAIVMMRDDTTENRWLVASEGEGVYYGQSTTTGTPTFDNNLVEIINPGSDTVTLSSGVGFTPTAAGDVRHLLGDLDGSYGFTIQPNASPWTSGEVQTSTGDNIHFGIGGVVRYENDGEKWMVYPLSEYYHQPKEYSLSASEVDLSIGEHPIIIFDPNSASPDVHSIVVSSGHRPGMVRTIVGQASSGEDLTLLHSSTSATSGRTFELSTASAGGSTASERGGLIIGASGAITVLGDAPADYSGDDITQWTPLYSHNVWAAPVEETTTTVPGGTDPAFIGAAGVGSQYRGTYYTKTTAPPSNQYHSADTGYDGARFRYINLNSTTISIVDGEASVNSGDSPFNTGIGVDLPVPQDCSVDFMYLTSEDEWVVTGGSALAKYAIDQIPTDSEIQTAASQNTPAFKGETATYETAANKLDWDTETLDTDGLFAAGDENITFTTATAGWWHIGAGAYFLDTDSALDYASLWIYKNSTIIARAQGKAFATGTDGYIALDCSTIVELTNGDTISARVSSVGHDAASGFTFNAQLYGFMVRKA